MVNFTKKRKCGVVLTLQMSPGAERAFAQLALVRLEAEVNSLVVLQRFLGLEHTRTELARERSRLVDGHVGR